MKDSKYLMVFRFFLAGCFLELVLVDYTAGHPYFSLLDAVCFVVMITTGFTSLKDF